MIVIIATIIGESIANRIFSSRCRQYLESVRLSRREIKWVSFHGSFAKDYLEREIFLLRAYIYDSHRAGGEFHICIIIVILLLFTNI